MQRISAVAALPVGASLTGKDSIIIRNARKFANGCRASSPTIKAASLKPSKDLPLSFDLGVQGYVGKREGVTGSLQIRYEF